ncbi:MAG: M48 family metalloprotease [Inquilinaceae bacterium]
MLRRFLSFGLAVALVAGSVGPAAAQNRPMAFIRDAEIEHTIHTYLRPILEVAGLAPSAVDVILVNAPTLNAFVAGGQNVFIHTATLMQADDPGQLIGVLAHETGHMAGGHLAQGQQELESAQRTALLTTLLGMAAAVASGNAGAGAAVIGAGGTVAERSFLSFTRAMENAADQAAITYLNRTGISAEGFLAFMEKLEDQELVPVNSQVEYARTHPLSRDRVDFIRNQVAQSPATGTPLPADYYEMFDRMQAKLIGYLTPAQALTRYPADDTSIAGQYGRAIALFRRGDMDGAHALTDALLAAEPDNPFFHEWKGQMLLETGRAAEARPYYERAVALYPDEPLLLIPLAQTKLESNDPADLQSAIANLEGAVDGDDGGSPLAWRLLAIAYGKTGDVGMAAVALAEEALARGDDATARQQSERAQQTLPEGSRGWLRAQDIARAAEKERS